MNQDQKKQDHARGPSNKPQNGRDAARQREGTQPQQNEGEGSRTASRNYNDGVKATIDAGRVDELAEDAKLAVDGPDRDALWSAENQGKQGKIPTARGEHVPAEQRTQQQQQGTADAQPPQQRKERHDRPMPKH